MVIKNKSPFHFSLEGVIIEPGQVRSLPDEQAQRFLNIYAHTDRLVRVEDVDYDTVQSGPKPMTIDAQATLTIAEQEEVIEEEIREEKEEVKEETSSVSSIEEVPPPLKVFSKRKKKQ